MRCWLGSANNLGKVLYWKENRELAETIGEYADGLVPIGTLSVAKTPKKDGKGNPYVDMMSRHMPLLDAMRTVSRNAFCG